MADEKQVDKTATKIADIYTKGIQEIVSALYKPNAKADPLELAKGLQDLPIEDIVKSKLSNIKTEFVKGHIEVLKKVKPSVNND